MSYICSPSPTEHSEILALNLQSSKSFWHLWFTLWLCSAKPDEVRVEMWRRGTEQERGKRGGRRYARACFFFFTSTVLQFVVNTHMSVRPGSFVPALSLRANKLIYNSAKGKQTENCQHRCFFFFFEEEQMIKSVRFTNKLTTSVLFLSPSLCW